MTSPYEFDIASQPQALRALSLASLPRSVEEQFARRFSRIVITGMGTSHYAGYSTWKSLVNAGQSAWWIDTSQLLDVPELITDDTLLIVTSQSGRSGEIVALLKEIHQRSCVVVGVVNDEKSPLADQANVFIAMSAGDEATVSTKSYLNSLVIHAELSSVLVEGHCAPIRSSLVQMAGDVEMWLKDDDPLNLNELGLQEANSRLVLIGSGMHAATVLAGALIIKEASKKQAEAYLGGEFRHGPIELAGPGLAAIILVDPDSASNDLRRLSIELRQTGSRVTELREPFGHDDSDEAWGLRAQFFGTIALQRLSVALARQSLIEPGAFLFGQKITEAV